MNREAILRLLYKSLKANQLAMKEQFLASKSQLVFLFSALFSEEIVFSNLQG
tara:strand:- start:755 stop:910 length:156 start_codon:yes stop_codon:yes gene_type:complete